MKQYKVCVYAICKNEASFVDSWMDSMSEADEIIVTDTGSTDNTVEKLRERGAIVYVDIVTPWRFDVARNVSLSHVPEDVDICVCTDFDELFEAGWRQKLEYAWAKYDTKPSGSTVKTGSYLYNWSLKADGSPDIQFTYFKIHERHGFTWVYPIHEIIRYTGDLPVDTVIIEDLVLNHYPDPTKSRGSYLPLLETAVAEKPFDDRVTYYLGREYMYTGEWQKCIDTLKTHLALPSATWNEERCASMRWIAHSYSVIGNVNEAYSWYYRAIAEASHLRDPYVEFAKMTYLLNDWSTLFFLVEEALKIVNKSTTYVNMGYSWDYTLNDLGAIACYNLKMYDRSIYHSEVALAFDVSDQRLINNHRSIVDSIDSLRNTPSV
jgi:glycosyltransferase involved in cell wall biosynthesis